MALQCNPNHIATEITHYFLVQWSEKESAFVRVVKHGLRKEYGGSPPSASLSKTTPSAIFSLWCQNRYSSIPLSIAGNTECR